MGVLATCRLGMGVALTLLNTGWGWAQFVLRTGYVSGVELIQRD